MIKSSNLLLYKDEFIELLPRNLRTIINHSYWINLNFSDKLILIGIIIPRLERKKFSTSNYTYHMKKYKYFDFIFYSFDDSHL